MSTTMTAGPGYRSTPGPVHTILLAGTVPLYLGALLSDIAYHNSHQIQWSNFASWLLAGAEVFCGFALLFALVNLLRHKHKGGRPLLYVVLLLLTFVLGLVNCFEHAKDAWAIMPAALVWSVIVTVLAIAATWVGLTTRTGGAQ